MLQLSQYGFRVVARAPQTHEKTYDLASASGIYEALSKHFKVKKRPEYNEHYKFFRTEVMTKHGVDVTIITLLPETIHQSQLSKLSSHLTDIPSLDLTELQTSSYLDPKVLSFFAYDLNRKSRCQEALNSGVKIGKHQFTVEFASSMLGRNMILLTSTTPKTLLQRIEIKKHGHIKVYFTDDFNKSTTMVSENLEQELNAEFSSILANIADEGEDSVWIRKAMTFLLRNNGTDAVRQLRSAAATARSPQVEKQTFDLTKLEGVDAAFNPRFFNTRSKVAPYLSSGCHFAAELKNGEHVEFFIVKSSSKLVEITATSVRYTKGLVYGRRVHDYEATAADVTQIVETAVERSSAFALNATTLHIHDKYFTLAIIQPDSYQNPYFSARSGSGLVHSIVYEIHKLTVWVSRPGSTKLEKIVLDDPFDGEHFMSLMADQHANKAHSKIFETAREALRRRGFEDAAKEITP
jgi:hypothetical protein